VSDKVYYFGHFYISKRHINGLNPANADLLLFFIQRIFFHKSSNIPDIRERVVIFPDSGTLPDTYKR